MSAPASRKTAADSLAISRSTIARAPIAKVLENVSNPRTPRPRASERSSR